MPHVALVENVQSGAVGLEDSSAELEDSTWWYENRFI